MFMGAVGIGVGGWYAGWFERDTRKENLLVKKLQAEGRRVVVFEIDGVLSSAKVEGCVPKHELELYLQDTSQDFIPAVRALAFNGFKLAIACTADPAVWDKKLGSNRDRYLVGPELAKALVAKRCPEAGPALEIMVGYDPQAHGAAPEDMGKRYHMRRIAKHYGAMPNELILFDPCTSNLANEEGWQGVLVRDVKLGFQFDDYLKAP